jgi:hypothetical protein
VTASAEIRFSRSHARARHRPKSGGARRDRSQQWRGCARGRSAGGPGPTGAGANHRSASPSRAVTTAGSPRARCRRATRRRPQGRTGTSTVEVSPSPDDTANSGVAKLSIGGDALDSEAAPSAEQVVASKKDWEQAVDQAVAEVRHAAVDRADPRSPEEASTDIDDAAPAATRAMCTRVPITAFPTTRPPVTTKPPPSSHGSVPRLQRLRCGSAAELLLGRI